MQPSWQLAIRARSITRTWAAAAGTVSAILASGSAFAQAPDPRTGASTPVQVVNTATNPVPVKGIVTGEVKLTNSRIDAVVVNDSVNKPYLVSHSQAFIGGNATQFEFDVPDGMRLIVETITVRFALRSPGNAVVQFGARTASGALQGGEIAVQQQGTIVDDFGESLSWIVGTHAIKMRVDASPGRDDELIVFPRLPVVSGTANAFVAGYLVPLQ